MKRDQGICPNCGSGDIEFLLRRPDSDDLFSSVPSANRHCFVCGILWEVDEIDLDTRTA
jgi:hypothetical protein